MREQENSAEMGDGWREFLLLIAQQEGGETGKGGKNVKNNDLIKHW